MFCYSIPLKKSSIFLYYLKESIAMMKLTIYHNFAEHTFEGDGHLETIETAEESNHTYIKVDFNRSHQQALCDFLCCIPPLDNCRVLDNDGNILYGEYIGASRMDGNPLLKISNISRYI